MRYSIPKLPESVELIAFEIMPGVHWRLSYWAWRLFRIQLPMRFRGFVVKLKEEPPA